MVGTDGKIGEFGVLRKAQLPEALAGALDRPTYLPYFHGEDAAGEGCVVAGMWAMLHPCLCLQIHTAHCKLSRHVWRKG